MNVPQVAKSTFDKLKDLPEYSGILSFILHQLKKITRPIKRARFVHRVIDEYNTEVYLNPLIKELSPCIQGCTACCYTQVSVTEDEAELLVKKILDGQAIDQNALRKQAMAQDDTSLFFKIPYEERKCIFLNSEGSCSVYHDRPAVCRTNAVLGDSSQCDTRDTIKPLRLVLTQKSDMVIYAAFLTSTENGTLPHMIFKNLVKKGILSST